MGMAYIIIPEAAWKSKFYSNVVKIKTWIYKKEIL